MKKYINEDLIKILISIILFIVSLFTEAAEVNLALLAISYAIISTGIYINAYHHVKKKIFFDENLLMIIATLCAFAIGSNEEAVMVMLLFHIGEYLSDLAVDNSKKSITKLMDLRVEKANKLINGEIVEVITYEYNKQYVIRVNENFATIILDGDTLSKYLKLAE